MALNVSFISKKNFHYPDFTTQFRLQLIILREGTGAIFLKDQHLFSRNENSQSLLKPFTLYPGRQKLLVAREKEPLVLGLQRSLCYLFSTLGVRGFSCQVFGLSGLGLGERKRLEPGYLSSGER